MLQANPRPELELVKAVLAGDSAAAQRFLDATAATLWSVVVKLEGDGPDGEELQPIHATAAKPINSTRHI